MPDTGAYAEVHRTLISTGTMRQLAFVGLLLIGGSQEAAAQIRLICQTQLG